MSLYKFQGLESTLWLSAKCTGGESTHTHTHTHTYLREREEQEEGKREREERKRDSQEVRQADTNTRRRRDRKWAVETKVGLNERDTECHRVNVSISVTVNAVRQPVLQTSPEILLLSVKGRVCPLLTALSNYMNSHSRACLCSLMLNVRDERGQEGLFSRA